MTPQIDRRLPERIVIACPRAHSDYSPCCARDGGLAMADDGKCVGCEMNVGDLFRNLVAKYIELKDGAKPE